MSIKVQSYVWEHSKQKGGCLLVLLAIADFADDAGQAYPSVETLAKKARLSERQAHYVLKQLQEDGEIAIHPNQGPKGCNLYAIRMKEGVQKPQGAKTSGVQSTTKGGAVCDKKGVQSIAPEPSIEPSEKPPESTREEDEEEKIARLSPVDAFSTVFPNHLGIHQQTQIEARTLDPRAWARTLIEWRTNSYSKRNLTGMFDKHRDTLAKMKAEQARAAPAGKPIIKLVETPEEKQARLRRINQQHRRTA